MTDKINLLRETSKNCRNCGVPFCQAGIIFDESRIGCPLGNLIPEWNQHLIDGNMEQALSRLLKTNPFPEFTSRLCPAFCQHSCLQGLHGRPLPIKANEQSIIEYAFQNGLMTAKKAEASSGKTVAVVGSGPCGLTVAHYLNARGHTVTVFEKEDKIGGELVKSVPAKRLAPEIVERRVKLMTDSGVNFVTGKEITDFEALNADFDAHCFCAEAQEKKDQLVVLAILRGKKLAAMVDEELMGYTNIFN